MTPKTGFEDNFLSKLGRIDPRRVREYVARILTRKNFFETIFDHLNEGVVVTDGRLRILYCNRFARELLRWPSRRRFLAEPLDERCPEGELRDLLRELRAAPREIRGRECILEGSPGGEARGEAERRLVVNAIEMRSAPSSVEGESAPGETTWVILLDDITERSKIIEEQARSRRLETMALLTSGVAHEIKNPLNSINIHAQLLEQEAAEATDREGVRRDHADRAAKIILEETARMTGIINDFIQAVRPQAIARERKYINLLIEELLLIFRPECEARGIELRTDLDPSIPQIHIDEKVVFQAVRNLVRNAVESFDGRESKPEADDASELPPDPIILVRTRLVREHVTIEVADNGPGIDEAHIDKIFEPYYTTKATGTGLGLMVVYRIVTEHGGSLHVDSRPGIGTRFLISLPLTERPVRLLEGPTSSRQPDPLT